MADVYEAVDLSLQRSVAVKVLHPHFAADPAFVERFEREARSVASLNHPNVVAIYDQGVDGEPFLVMELVAGHSLAELLRRQGALRPGRALDIACEVLAALAHAHARGLVHCDVKAENVLVTANGHAKLGDFGIARAAAAATSTQTQQLFGSVHYLAPERLAGQPATPAVDLYSVGVLLYLMLTGRLPFVGDDLAAVVAQHQQQSPRPPSELRADLPSWLEGVVLRALAKEPSDRFPSAEAMESSLKRGRREAADLPTVRIATPIATSGSEQRDALPAGWRGLSARAGEGARSLPRRYLIALAPLLLLAGLGISWGLVAGPGAGGPASPPAVTPSAVSLPSVPLKVAPTIPLPTATRPPATPTPTAVPTVSPDTLRRQALDRLRALVENSGSAAWKGKAEREFLKQLDELEKRMAAGNLGEVRDRIREMIQQASEMERDGQLDRRLGDQIINQLRGLQNLY